MNFTGTYNPNTYIIEYPDEDIFLKQYASQWWDLLTTAMIMKDTEPQCNRLAHMLAHAIGNILDHLLCTELDADSPNTCGCCVDTRFADPGVHFVLSGVCNHLALLETSPADLLIEKLHDIWKVRLLCKILTSKPFNCLRGVQKIRQHGFTLSGHPSALVNNEQAVLVRVQKYLVSDSLRGRNSEKMARRRRHQRRNFMQKSEKRVAKYGF